LVSGHLANMPFRETPQLDMTPDGRFREPPRTPLATRIARTALVVAVLAGVLAALILALWFALALIPVAIGAGLVAWAAFRFQLWRARRSARGGRDVFRV
jgi:hypothetical protein